MLHDGLVGFLKTSALWGLKSETQIYELKNRRNFLPLPPNDKS